MTVLQQIPKQKQSLGSGKASSGLRKFNKISIGEPETKDRHPYSQIMFNPILTFVSFTQHFTCAISLSSAQKPAKLTKLFFLYATDKLNSRAGVRMCARYRFISSRPQIHCQVPEGRFSHKFRQHSTTATSATVLSILSNEIWISERRKFLRCSISAPKEAERTLKSVI